jgi:hypothetical protein
MANYGSASPHKPESHKQEPLNPDLKRRARLLAVDSRVHHDTRGLIRMALEMKDPALEQLVHRVEAGEMHIEHLVLDGD